MLKNSPSKDEIYSQEKSSHWLIMIVGLAFIFLPMAGYEQIMTEINKGEFIALLALIFPLIGLFIFFKAVKTRKDFLAIGLMPLSLSPPTGQIGGHIGGQILLNQPWEKRQFNLTLSCLHNYSTGNGKDSTSHTDIIWQKECYPVDKPYQLGSSLEFCFDDIDAQLPADGSFNGKGSIRWELNLEGHHKHLNINRHWTIPVENGTLVSDIKIPDSHRRDEQEHKQGLAIESVNAQIKIDVSQEELYLLSESGRNSKVSTPLIVIGLIFSGVAAFLLNVALAGELMLWIMAPIFIIVGLSIFGFGLFLKGRQLESKIQDEYVYVRRMLFGRVIYKHKGILNSANQLKLSSSLSSQQGSKKTEYMVITAHVVCDDNKTRDLKLVEGIEGRLAGEAMLKKIVDYMM